MTQTSSFTRRLAKICGMFGSQFDGERSNAAKSADDMVRSAGLSWQEVFGGLSQKWREPTNPTEAIVACQRHKECLNDWEREFLESILTRSCLTSKQVRVLDRLVNRVRIYAEA